MREILFRGKRIDNGEWVEGYYMKHINRTLLPINDSVEEKDVEYIIFYDAFSDWNMPRGIEGTHIDPATLGQYTGLTDKNGAKVFEGDILQIAKKSDTLGTYFFPPVQYPINVVVKWDLCAWMWEVQGKEGPYYIHFPDAWCHYECKVIGNIHDNGLEDFDGG